MARHRVVRETSSKLEKKPPRGTEGNSKEVSGETPRRLRGYPSRGTEETLTGAQREASEPPAQPPLPYSNIFNGKFCQVLRLD